MSNAKSSLLRLIDQMSSDQLLAFTLWQQYNYPVGKPVPLTWDVLLTKAEAQELATDGGQGEDIRRMKVVASSGLRKRVLKRNPDGLYEVGDKIETLPYGTEVDVIYPPFAYNNGEWYRLVDNSGALSAIYLDPISA